MSKDDFVGLAFKVCPACQDRHDEVVLVHCKFGSVPPRSFAGYALCPKCREHSAEFVTLIEVTGNPNAGDAKFTGNVARLRWAAADRILTGVEVPRSLAFAFIDPDAMAKLAAMAPPSTPQPGAPE
jgi:hypothetical protein